MWCRGRLSLLVMALLLCVSSVVQGVPPHENFDEADEDLLSIVSFVADTEMLCERCLEQVVLTDVSVEVDLGVSLFVEWDQVYDSVVSAGWLDKKLSYTAEMLDKIEGAAGSFQYLKDVVVPLKQLGGNVSLFVRLHEDVVLWFESIVENVSVGGNQTGLLFDVAACKTNISECRRVLEDIEVGVLRVGELFSTDKLSALVVEIGVLLDRYEQFLASLIAHSVGVEPTLLLYVEDSVVFLSENVSAYGFFLADKSFVANASIDLFWDEEEFCSVQTDRYGRYECNIPIGVNHELGVFRLQSSVWFNNSQYVSEELEVMVQRMPTKLVLSTVKSHFYRNETIVFSGRLVDYKNRGVLEDVSISFADEHMVVKTDEFGRFSYVFDADLLFGSYAAQGRFNATRVYGSCVSNVVVIWVDTPTSLSVSLSDTEVTIGNEVVVSGRLLNALDGSAVSGMDVELVFGGEIKEKAVTNRSGWYVFQVTTDGFNTGRYAVYTQFISEDVKWRSASSEQLFLMVNPGLFQQIQQHPLSDFIFENVFWIVFSVVFLIVLVYWFIKRKSEDVVEKQKPVSVKKVGVTIDKILMKRARKFGFPRRKSLFESLQSERDCKQAIISRYRLLLRFLNAHGVSLSARHTHLDVYQKLLESGVNRRAVDRVVSLFEQARYSLYPVTVEDVRVFEQEVFSIVSDFRG